MASINGVRITSLKSFRDHEGAACYQGNVSYKNKKLGFWSQDAWNACCDDYDFDETILDKATADFKDGFSDEYMYKDVISTEVLLGDLVSLMQVEKNVKKQLKDDRWRAVVYIGNNTGSAQMLSVPDEATDEEILRKYRKDIKGMQDNLESGAFNYNDGRKSTFTHIYRSAGDFNLTIDKENPVPDIFLTL